MKKTVFILVFMLLFTAAASAEGGMTQTMTLTLTVPDRTISVYTGEHAGIIAGDEIIKDSDEGPAAVSAPRLEDLEILLAADEGWIITEVSFGSEDMSAGIFDAETGTVRFTAVPADETVYVTAVPDVPGWSWETNEDGGTCAVTAWTGDDAEPEVPSVIGGMNVTRIADGAFADSTNVTKVTIPHTVSDIGANIFGEGMRVTVACHEGSAAHLFAMAGGYEAEVTAHSGGPADCVTGWTCEICDAEIAPQGHVIAFEQDIYETTENEALELTLVQSCTDELGPITWTGADNGMFTAADIGVYNVTAATGDGFTAPAGCSVIVHAAQPLRLPASLKSIGAEAFMDDTAVTEAVLPAGCTAIEAKAFANCTGLRIVILPASVETIAADAFAGCDGSLTLICATASQAEYAQANGLGYILTAEG